MTTEAFDQSIRDRMEYALELACRGLPANRQGHEWRKLVAEEILACAREGNTSLSELSAAGRRAVVTKLGGASFSVVNSSGKEYVFR